MIATYERGGERAIFGAVAWEGCPWEVVLDTTKRIVTLLTSQYGVDPGRISPAAGLAELGLNSLTLAELVCDVEESFGIDVRLAEEDVATLGDIVALVDRLVAERGR